MRVQCGDDVVEDELDWQLAHVGRTRSRTPIRGSFLRIEPPLGARLAATSKNAQNASNRISPATRIEMILILTSDAVAGALLGAWIETLGYAVHFAQPQERPEQSFRRLRPKVCLIDCEDPALCNTETLGRAAM